MTVYLHPAMEKQTTGWNISDSPGRFWNEGDEELSDEGAEIVNTVTMHPDGTYRLAIDNTENHFVDGALQHLLWKNRVPNKLVGQLLYFLWVLDDASISQCAQMAFMLSNGEALGDVIEAWDEGELPQMINSWAELSSVYAWLGLHYAEEQGTDTSADDFDYADYGMTHLSGDDFVIFKYCTRYYLFDLR